MTPKVTLSRSAAAVVALGITSFGITSTASAQSAPFGGEEDVAYAAELWAAMKELRLAGDNAIDSFPYEGQEPHGAILETFHTTLELDGHSGHLSVKRNYGPAGISIEEVSNDPDEHLDAITVMFQREDGYDPDHGNWYWVKYLPDGSLDKNPAGMQLAGRVAKGNDEAGCIACHTGAGDDYLFTTDLVR